RSRTGAVARWSVSLQRSSRRTLRRRTAEFAEALVRGDPGVVPVRPDGVQAVGADQGDVRELILAGMEKGVRAEAAPKPRFALASRTRAGAPEHGERDVMRGAVGPIDQQRSMLLVVVEAHGSQLLGHRARTLRRLAKHRLELHREPH